MKCIPIRTKKTCKTSHNYFQKKSNYWHLSFRLSFTYICRRYSYSVKIKATPCIFNLVLSCCWIRLCSSGIISPLRSLRMKIHHRHSSCKCNSLWVFVNIFIWLKFISTDVDENYFPLLSDVRTSKKWDVKSSWSLISTVLRVTVFASTRKFYDMPRRGKNEENAELSRRLKAVH